MAMCSLETLLLKCPVSMFMQSNCVELQEYFSLQHKGLSATGLFTFLLIRDDTRKFW